MCGRIIMQATLVCSLLLSGTLSFGIVSPFIRRRNALLIRKARAQDDEEHQAWLQSSERFSPEWLQKDIDKNKLPNPDAPPAGQINGDTTAGQQQAAATSPPVNGGGVAQPPVTPGTGGQAGMVASMFNQGQQPVMANQVQFKPPDNPPEDRFSPQWLQNPNAAPGTDIPAMDPNQPQPQAAGQQSQQANPTAGQPQQAAPAAGGQQQQQQQTTTTPPEDRFSPAWLQNSANPAHGGTPGMPDGNFSPDAWLGQPFEGGPDGPMGMMDGGPMGGMMMDEGRLEADRKGAKDWTVPSGAGGQVAAAMGDDFAAFAMNQGGMMEPPPPPGGMMQPPPGMTGMNQGGMMQPPPPGMQQQPGMDPFAPPPQGGMLGQPQQGGMPPPQQGITAFPSQPNLVPETPPPAMSEEMSKQVVEQFEATMAALDQGKSPREAAMEAAKKKFEKGKAKDSATPPKVTETKAREGVSPPAASKEAKENVPPVPETKAQTKADRLFNAGNRTAVAPSELNVVKTEDAGANKTAAANFTASALNTTTKVSSGTKTATTKQKEMPRNFSILEEYRDLRRDWDKTKYKREAEEEERRQKADLKRKYEETLAEVERTYKAGLQKCTQVKLDRFQELEDEKPKTTDLAVGLARMGHALRKMKDSDKDKKALEAEMLIWQEQYDRAEEEEEAKGK